MPDNFTTPTTGSRCGGNYQCPDVKRFIFYFFIQLMSINFSSSLICKNTNCVQITFKGWVCLIGGVHPTFTGYSRYSGGEVSDFDVMSQEYSNPNLGFTNYDNLGTAIVNIITAISLSGWTDQMCWITLKILYEPLLQLTLLLCSGIGFKTVTLAFSRISFLYF